MPTYIPAKKSLGQNFLVNPRIIAKIIDAADIKKGDAVLEVGPGTGNLTRALAARARCVIAIEKDHRLIEKLRAAMPSNVEIVEGDALHFDPIDYSLLANGYKIVANIPYYITSHFIRIVLEQWPRPSILVLTVQKEVAERIIAHPPRTNLLALSMRLYADARIIMRIKRGSFHPVPAVDSAVIILEPRVQSQGSKVEAEKILAIAKKAFAGKRKQLINSLTACSGSKAQLAEKLKQAGISPSARPEELSISQWSALVHALKSCLFQETSK